MKPSLPQGTRDFRPDVLRRRYYIIGQIKSFFEIYGFEPLETPALENLETLTGKYGDEGDKLIFKILNNGLDNVDKRKSTLEAFENVLAGRNEKNITSRALRYDLTIPFARFVASNYHQLAMPFKRFQIQPVWRADRPQRGRYREFYQCDADVAGTFSLKADAEFALLYRDVFHRLNVPVKIKINNRKLLQGIAEAIGNPQALKTITVAIDKLDKIGTDAVKEELINGGISESSALLIEKYMALSGTRVEKFNQLRILLKDSETGQKGLDELEEIFGFLGKDEIFQLDTTLARGLEYYTGTIYEIKAENVQIGSIGGGGRYDDLTGLFGVKGVPGVGISFGIDRIYDVMEELKLFPADIERSSSALFFNMGEREAELAFRLMQQCRQAGIACEMFYENTRLDKQFRYAEKRNIPLAVIIGSKELERNICKIKDLQSGIEEEVPLINIEDFLSRMEKH